MPDGVARKLHALSYACTAVWVLSNGLGQLRYAVTDRHEIYRMQMCLTCRSLGFSVWALPPFNLWKALVTIFPPCAEPGPKRSGTQALICGKLKVSLFSIGTSSISCLWVPTSKVTCSALSRSPAVMVVCDRCPPLAIPPAASAGAACSTKKADDGILAESSPTSPSFLCIVTHQASALHSRCPPLSRPTQQVLLVWARGWQTFATQREL